MSIFFPELRSKAELNFGYVEPYSMRDLLQIWTGQIEEKHSRDINNIFTRTVSGEINQSEHELLSRQAADERYKNLPKRDGLTGAYQRGELFNLLKIARELGHEKVKATVMDMNFLKDHNNWLGEPTGGDYVLRVFSIVAQSMVDQFGAVLLRPQEAGGDDFMFLEFPSEDAPDRDLGSLLNDALSKITFEEYVSGRVKGTTVARYDDSKQILLDEGDIKRLQENPDLLSMIIPPTVAQQVFDINTQADIQTLGKGDSIRYDFTNIATKLKQAMTQIKLKKSEAFKRMLIGETPGVGKLARKQ